MNYYYGMQAFKKYGLVETARDKEMHEIVRLYFIILFLGIFLFFFTLFLNYVFFVITNLVFIQKLILENLNRNYFKINLVEKIY
jgi:hypothetical protein